MWRAMVTVIAGMALGGDALAEAIAAEAIANDRLASSIHWLADEAKAAEWSSGALSIGVWTFDAPALEVTRIDPALSPAQFMSPAIQSPQSRQPTRLPTSVNRPSLGAAGTATTSAGMASIPYMIGDTGSGTCIGFGGLLEADLSHPSLACGRLNIAEANTPLVVDRVYYSYRHFENTSRISTFQFGQTLDVERHTLGWENTFWDRMGSLELRMPIDERMRSDIFSLITPNFGVVDPLVGPNGGRQAELGNVSAILKFALLERQSFYLSGGVGVTLPTAKDVDYHVAVDGIIDYPSTPGLQADMAAAFETIFANETVYISPFAAWIYAPQSRWFHQGFFQVEVAANPSKVTFDGDGATVFYQNGAPIGFYDFFTPVPVRANLIAQTLMRLNLGAGYRIMDAPDARWMRQLVALFELHYTSTLNDAAMTSLPLTAQSSVGTVPLQSVVIGNKDNRVDIVNVGTGLSGQFGNWIVTNGFVAPVKSEPNRGFDFEYNLQVQRAF